LVEKSIFWLFFIDVITLGYLGGMPIQWPYNVMSVVLCILYFILLWAISSDLEQFIFKKRRKSFRIFL
jgi:quinol-cytochrome oxidoreductase complex cytochrome b subunit